MKVTYDKEPRCYICGRNDDELNHFLLNDIKDLDKALEKASKIKSKKIKKIKDSNKKVHEKHMKHLKDNPVNYEFTMETIKKDYDAFVKIIPDLKELVELFDICDKLDLQSKLKELIKCLKDYYNENQVAEEDKEIRTIEYQIGVLDKVKMKFEPMSSKLEFLSEVDPFEIKGTKYENMVVSVEICPICEKLVKKFGH